MNIDELLNWRYHIKYVKAKLSKSAAVMYRCSQLVDRTTMHMLYCSIFMPYLTYCPDIWGNTYPTSVESINVLQKRVMRIVYGAKRLAHTSPLFLKLSILKFSDLCKLRTLLLMNKAYYNLFPLNIQCLFSKRVTTYPTRLNNQFDKPLHHYAIDVPVCLWSETLELNGPTIN